MQVHELIEELRNMPGEAEVLVEHECAGADVAPIVRLDTIKRIARPAGTQVLITTRD
jgi:hypothetical protein